MRGFIRLVAYASLLLPSAALAAGDWFPTANCSGNAMGDKPAISPAGPKRAFYCLSGTSTTDSQILTTIDCSAVTVQHIKTTSSDLSTAFVRSCDGDTGLLATGKSYCQPILMDSDGGGIDDEVMNGDAGNDVDGDGTKENRGIMWGFGPIDNIYIDTVTAPDTGQTTRFKVTCHGAR